MGSVLKCVIIIGIKLLIAFSTLFANSGLFFFRTGKADSRAHRARHDHHEGSATLVLYV